MSLRPVSDVIRPGRISLSRILECYRENADEVQREDIQGREILRGAGS
jgi:hypothetical protein